MRALWSDRQNCSHTCLKRLNVSGAFLILFLDLANGFWGQNVWCDLGGKRTIERLGGLRKWDWSGLVCPFPLREWASRRGGMKRIIDGRSDTVLGEGSCEAFPSLVVHLCCSSKTL